MKKLGALLKRSSAFYFLFWYNVSSKNTGWDGENVIAVAVGGRRCHMKACRALYWSHQLR